MLPDSQSKVLFSGNTDVRQFREFFLFIILESKDKMPNFDQVYNNVLGECEGNLILFLDSFFGFLYRQSDFFQEKSNQASVVGLHPAQNKNLLLAVFNKWDKFAKSEADNDHKLALREVPIAVREEVVESRPKEQDNEGEMKKTKSVSKNEDHLVNGADLGHYKWSQTQSDIEVIIPVIEDIRKGKDVKVTCTTDSIKIQSMISMGGRDDILVEGKLFSSVKASELMWNLIPGSQVVLHLEKRNHTVWPKLLLSEENSVILNNCEGFQELSESDRMAVEYAMKKNSIKEKEDQAQLNDLLKTAWNQEGSPFKGTPFDPSKIAKISK